jgi:16S rRNA G966 N2-methylase RsmD
MQKQFNEIVSFSDKLFGNDVELLPSVTETFELQMAHLEYNVLDNSDLIPRSAFFKSVNGDFTNHFLTYSKTAEALTRSRSSKTKQYFQNGQFSTGYAVHSLFPYRGKFHPQLIKGLLNIIGINKGETVLDPMCGSGTLNIEAALMGINSYGIDVSPFCQFMTKTKYVSLFLEKENLAHLKDTNKIFDFFQKHKSKDILKKINKTENSKVYKLALLAFLDALGYSMRVKSTHRELFGKVLVRYIDTVLEFSLNPYFNSKIIGRVEILPDSNATKIKLENNSVDAVITSPPYSFAINYVKNDQAQLEFLGYDVEELKSKMIGLVGKNKDERLSKYFDTMESVCKEIHRVLKKDKIFVMIIGSNTNQTGGIRLEQTVIDNCKKIGLSLVKSILKPIKGMRNTMKDEYVLFFKKVT